MKLNVPITIDPGVSLPADDKPKGVYHVFLNSLQSMAIGDSFFREGETRAEIEGLLRYAKRNGIHLKAVDLDEDEIYLAPGVRVERVSQDSLPGRKPEVSDNDKTYWRLGKGLCPRVMILEPGEVPEANSGWTQITVVEHRHLVQTCPDHVTYWHHPESESVWASPKDHEFDGDGLAHEIDLEAFIRLSGKGKQIDASHAKSALEATTYWKNKITGLIIAYLPGKKPDDKKAWVEVEREDYDQQLAREGEERAKAKELVTTWWRKANGMCVEVPPEKHHIALKTPGAKEITEDEYKTYLLEQDEEV
jgi:hypothetical protein